MEANGEVIGKAAYDTYGNRTHNSGITSNFGFAGEYTDPESGLTYLRARYYDPATAQFMTTDPRYNLTKERYGYAAGDPTLITDPGGECPMCLGAALGGAMSTATYLIENGSDSSLEGAALNFGIGALGGALGAGAGSFVGRLPISNIGKISVEATVGGAIGVGEEEALARITTGRSAGDTAIGISGGLGALSGALPGSIGKFFSGPSPAMNDVVASYIQFVPESITAAFKESC